MKENKLVELSMDFSVDIINLVKYLKVNHETLYPTKSAEAAPRLEQIFTKRNMHKERRTLYPNSK